VSVAGIVFRFASVAIPEGASVVASNELCRIYLLENPLHRSMKVMKEDRKLEGRAYFMV